MKAIRFNLEKSRLIFREFGLVLVLGSVLFCLEIKSYDSTGAGLNMRAIDNTPEEFVEITQHKTKPPPPPDIVKQTSLISIVDNEIDIDEEIEVNVEADQETIIEEYVPEFEDDSEEIEEEEEMIFVIVESMPMFPGGEAARLKFLNEHIRYPTMAKEAGIQGRVFIQFVVEKDGSITDVKVVRGIGGGCDEEAVRLVESMPPWIPGKQRHSPVRVRFNMPIRFVLL